MDSRLNSLVAADPLVELPVEKWPIMRNKLKSLWPMNISGYHLLDSGIENSRIRKLFELKVYCPYGDMDNGCFATTVLASDYREFFMFPVSENMTCMEEALVNTEIINWNGGMTCWNMISSLAMKSFNRIQAVKNLNITKVIPMKLLFKDKNSKTIEASCLPDTYIAPIREEHVKHINEVWSRKNESSHEYFSKLIACGRSYGLYYKDELAAWIFLNEFYLGRHLYCEDKFKGNGFAVHLVLNIISKQLKDGFDVTGCVVNDNEVVWQYAPRLGFEEIDECTQVFFK